MPALGGINSATSVALASDVTDHTGDTSDAHDASAISVADAGGLLAASDVEAALAELAVARTGLMLGKTEWAPGTQQLLTIASGTIADLDATNAKVDFTAPPSGSVIVQATGWVDGPDAGGHYFWGLRSGSTTVGLPRNVTRDAENGYLVTANFLVTGLTPGTAYTFKLAHYRDGTGTGRTIVHDGVYPPLNMLVFDAGTPAATSGTAFPASPVTGQRFYRTDKNEAYVWNGTYWLSEEIYEIRSSVWPTTATGGQVAEALNGDVFALELVSELYSTGTPSGANYYTVKAQRVTPSNTYVDIGTHNTSADTGSTWTLHTTTINALVAGRTTNALLFLYFEKTLTGGGDVYGTARLTYRRRLT